MSHRFAVRELTAYFVFIDGNEGNLFVCTPKTRKTRKTKIKNRRKQSSSDYQNMNFKRIIIHVAKFWAKLYCVYAVPRQTRRRRATGREGRGVRETSRRHVVRDVHTT